MNKIAIIGDLHFGFGNIRISKRTYMNKVIKPKIDWAIQKMKQNGVKYIIQLGDLFDDRKNVDISILDDVYEIIEKLKDFEIYSIIGNHDIYYRNTRFPNSPSIILKNFKNIHIIEDLSREKIGSKEFLLVPWIVNDDDKRKFFNEIDKMADVCIGHFEPSHISYTNDVHCYGDYCLPSNIKSPVFKSFDVIFSGHIHTRQTVKNFYYVGTLYPFTWKDYGSPKGICLYDIDNGNIEFIDNEPMMHKIDYDREIAGKAFDDIDFSKYNDKIIMILISERTDRQELTKFLKLVHDHEPLSVQVEIVEMEKIVENNVSDNIKIELSNNDILDIIRNVAVEYSEKRGLDKNKMIEIVSEICGG